MDLLIDFLSDPTDITLFCGEKVLLTSSDAIKEKKHTKCCGIWTCFGCSCCARCKPCCLKCKNKCQCKLLSKCKEKCRHRRQDKNGTDNDISDMEKGESSQKDKFRRKRNNKNGPKYENSSAEKGVSKWKETVQEKQKRDGQQKPGNEVIEVDQTSATPNSNKKCCSLLCFGCRPCVKCRETCCKSCSECKSQCCKKTQTKKQNSKKKSLASRLKSFFICRKYRNLKPWTPIRRNNIYLFLVRMWIGYLFDAIEIILLATGIGIVFQNQFWQAICIVYFVALLIFALVVTISVPICKRVHVTSATDGKKLIIPFGITLVIFKVTSCINAVFVFSETYTQRDAKPDQEVLSIILLFVSAFDMVLDAILMVTTCKRWIHCHLKQNRLKPLPMTTKRRESKVAIPKSLAVKPGPLTVPIKKLGPPSPGSPRLSPVPTRRASITPAAILPKVASVTRLDPIKQSATKK